MAHSVLRSLMTMQHPQPLQLHVWQNPTVSSPQPRGCWASQEDQSHYSSSSMAHPPSSQGWFRLTKTWFSETNSRLHLFLKDGGKEGHHLIDRRQSS